MNIHFLNSEYVRFFELKQLIADQQWYEWQDNAQGLIQQKHYRQAADYLGKCFELARILCNHDTPTSEGSLNHVEKLAVSGHQHF